MDSLKNMNGLIVVPAFNEEKVIASVVKKIPKKILNLELDILVVNDGSVDGTARVLRQIGANFITHPINRGLGAALGTGFEYARIHDYDFLVTLDGDGQHDPTDLPNLIKPIALGKADFVVGTRIRKKGMPQTRKVLTYLASLATYLFTGVWTTDSQSGFRVFSRLAISQIFVKVDRMEVSSDFFRQAKEKKLRIKEVSIKAIYTQYSLKKGQNVWNSLNILAKLTLQKLID